MRDRGLVGSALIGCGAPGGGVGGVGLGEDGEGRGRGGRRVHTLIIKRIRACVSETANSVDAC